MGWCGKNTCETTPPSPEWCGTLAVASSATPGDVGCCYLFIEEKHREARGSSIGNGWKWIKMDENGWNLLILVAYSMMFHDLPWCYTDAPISIFWEERVSSYEYLTQCPMARGRIQPIQPVIIETHGFGWLANIGQEHLSSRSFMITNITTVRV